MNLHLFLAFYFLLNVDFCTSAKKMQALVVKRVHYGARQLVLFSVSETEES